MYGLFSASPDWKINLLKLWTSRIIFVKFKLCGCRQGTGIQGAAGEGRDQRPLLTTNNAETLIMANDKIADCLKTIKFLPAERSHFDCVNSFISRLSLDRELSSLAVSISWHGRARGQQGAVYENRLRERGSLLSASPWNITSNARGHLLC